MLGTQEFSGIKEPSSCRVEMLLGRNKWLLSTLTEEKVLESHTRKKTQMK